MSTYIGFNLNSNRQIEHFQTIENRYGINSDGGKFLFGQAELALKGSYIPKEEVYLIPYQGAVQPGNIERFIKDNASKGQRQSPAEKTTERLPRIPSRKGKRYLQQGDYCNKYEPGSPDVQ